MISFQEHSCVLQVSIEDGLGKTIEYFREELGHQRRSQQKQLSLLRTWNWLCCYCVGMFVHWYFSVQAEVLSISAELIGCVAGWSAADNTIFVYSIAQQLQIVALELYRVMSVQRYLEKIQFLSLECNISFKVAHYIIAVTSDESCDNALHKCRQFYEL